VSETESSAALPEEIAVAVEPSPQPVPVAVQQEIDKLCDGFADGLRADLEQFVTSNRERSTRAAAEARTSGLESLAEAIRRIRAEDSVTAIATTLVDTSVLYCGRAILLINKGDKMLGFRSSGNGLQPEADAFQRLTFSTASAAAVAQAIDSRDMVTTTGVSSNVSSELVGAFKYAETDRVYVYPLRLRDKVLAVVLVDETGATPVEPAAVEVLISTAEAWIEAIGSRRKTVAAA
jgi:hypothetical protein